MTSAPIDDDVFPFSEAELRAALALVLPTARAEEDAARHTRELGAQRQSYRDFLARVVSAGASPRKARAGA